MRLIGFSVRVACQEGKAVVDFSLAYLVSVMLKIAKIWACVFSRGLAAADEPKPKEPAAK